MPPYLTILRDHIRSRRIAHELLDEPPRLRFTAQTRMGAMLVTVSVLPGIVSIIASIPGQAGEDSRPAVADFLHRANACLYRLQWLFDPDEGSIACRHILDPVHSLTYEHVQFAIDRLIEGVDAMLPAVIAVLQHDTPASIAFESVLDALNEANATSRTSVLWPILRSMGESRTQEPYAN